ncbi:hypothetical protein WN943_008117 [Citrus x changshan-huyou]|uniref:Uncharacterized protein n=1 Tax=Citrus unshiu TaxID=55188 RepID=A0A2H5NMR3_CITUN|nr:hypothetical protein CUMW_059760 [Citrus unshiu]
MASTFATTRKQPHSVTKGFPSAVTPRAPYQVKIPPSMASAATQPEDQSKYPGLELDHQKWLISTYRAIGFN